LLIEKLPLFCNGGAMDDAELVDKEDLVSAHTRAREVHGEVLTGPERRRRW
jgi:transposase